MGKEKVVVGTEGEFAHLGSGGVSVTKPEWKKSKIYLTHTHLWLVQGSKKESIPLKGISAVGRDVSAKIGMAPEKYVSIDYLLEGKTNTLAITGTKDEMKKLKRYILLLQLNNTPAYVLHPSKVGGVIQTDTKWQKRMLGITRGKGLDGITDILLFKAQGSNDFKILLSNVEQFKKDERKIGDSTKEIIDVTHDMGDNTYNTCIFTKNIGRLVEYLNDYLADKGVATKVSAETAMWAGDTKGPELSDKEEEVMVALYSGVSSLEMESVIEGLTSDDIDRLYDKMIRDGLAETVRIRKEIELTVKGKNIVNKKMAI